MPYLLERKGYVSFVLVKTINLSLKLGVETYFYNIAGSLFTFVPAP
jgi:hypothetical protein